MWWFGTQRVQASRHRDGRIVLDTLPNETISPGKSVFEQTPGVFVRNTGWFGEKDQSTALQSSYPPGGLGKFVGDIPASDGAVPGSHGRPWAHAGGNRPPDPFNGRATGPAPSSFRRRCVRRSVLTDGIRQGYRICEE